MKERPILFSSPMVRAILGGRKTQTRRVLTRMNSFYDGVRAIPERWADLNFNGKCFVDGGPSPVGNPGPYLHVPDIEMDATHRIYPMWQPGDRLWVRETCCAAELVSGLDGVRYIADDAFRPIENNQNAAYRWMELNSYRGRKGATVSPIHMPRWASRITLEITDVRVERLQEISEKDAEAEGVRNSLHLPGGRFARENFEHLWWRLHGDGAWEANPWVWVVEFKLVDQASTTHCRARAASEV